MITNLNCNFDQLSDFLRNAWKRCVDTGVYLCVDETIYAYFSQQKETVQSPQRYIPRKLAPPKWVVNLLISC